ncbi:MAG TPA: methyl coenzyme M reductase system, component A2 [Methanomicrobia archaeon]|nr:methyl coenzyme M reductase system, component A2 [Methanomicrobia archaeon]
MGDESEVFIKINGVSKSFEGKTALSNVSVDIREKEPLGLLGRSGSGKSVLLRMLRGSKEYEPDSGEIIFRIAICPSCSWVEGPSFVGTTCSRCGGVFEFQEVNFWQDYQMQRLLKSAIAIMLQRSFALYSDEGVVWNVLEALERAGYPKSKRLKRAYEILESVKMLHRANMPATRDLSGGEKQRMVLARQMALQPILLLADEPTGTLDHETARVVHKALLESTKGGTTFVVTSHWPYVIRELAKKTLWLDKGEMVEYGDTAKIIDDFEREVGAIARDEYKKFGEPKIRIEHLKKYYLSASRGVVKGVDDVSFIIYENEIFGVVGHSGAGKTSLMRIVSHLEPSTAGHAWVRIGEQWYDASKADLGTFVKDGVISGGTTDWKHYFVGVLHQEYTLYPKLTIWENLTHGIGLEMPDDLAKMKVHYMLQGVGFTDEEIEEILPKTHLELSVGEKQRILIAQLLMKEPEIAVLDEPTGTMDPHTKKYVGETIQKARENLGITFVIVTHDLDFAEAVCDRVAYMNQGKLEKIEDLRRAEE